jgi:hypothetical protein
MSGEGTNAPKKRGFHGLKDRRRYRTVSGIEIGEVRPNCMIRESIRTKAKEGGKTSVETKAQRSDSSPEKSGSRARETDQSNQSKDEKGREKPITCSL